MEVEDGNRKWEEDEDDKQEEENDGRRIEVWERAYVDEHPWEALRRMSSASSIPSTGRPSSMPNTSAISSSNPLPSPSPDSEVDCWHKDFGYKQIEGKKVDVRI